MRFAVSPPLYPPSEGWSAAYVLLLPSARASFAVTDDGQATYTVTLAAGTLDDVTAQVEARLIGTVTGSGAYAGERHVIYDRCVTVLPNPTSSTLDGIRSAAQIELAAVAAAILALTESNISAYALGSRSVTKLELPTLYKRQAVLEARVRSEQGLGFRRHLVEFVRA